VAGAVIRPITPSRFADLERLFRTSSITNSCWDIWPRHAPAEERERAALRDRRDRGEANREELRALAGRRRAPGLLAYEDKEPVGFVSLGPRTDMRRVDASRTTPRVDQLGVWVVPCLYIHPKHRHQGIAAALLRGAVDYAARHGAPAVEGYPRAPGTKVHDDFAFFGTVEMFRRAGYRVVRGPLPGLPKNWVPRYAMRADCARPPRPRARKAGKAVTAPASGAPPPGRPRQTAPAPRRRSTRLPSAG
jgi:GNAT superfamily N-acetyltransferase